MAEQLWHNREKFMLLHQSAVFMAGVAAIAISPEGNSSFFLPFAVALLPIFVAPFAVILDEKLAEDSRPIGTCFLSSFVGLLCSFGIMAMWFVWGYMEALRALGSAH